MSSSSCVRQFTRNPVRSFFMLWVPVLFSMVAEPLTGLVDTAFVARLGSEQLAALGIGTVVLTSGLWLFNFLAVGSQTEVSQAGGRNDFDRAKRFGSLAIFLAAAIGLCMALLVSSTASEITALMGGSGRLQEYSVAYIRLRALGGPAVLVTMASFGILYGLADMRSPLLVAVCVNTMNILLDWLLIFGIGPFPSMGVEGAALASSISQWVGAVWCLARIKKQLGFTTRVTTDDVRKLMSIGRDMFVRTGSLILFLLLATRSATRLGADAGAAHQAIRQVWIFTNLFLDASAVTAQSVVGYFFGSGSFVRAKQVAKLVSVISFMIGCVLLAVMAAGTTLAGAILVPASGLVLFAPAWMVSAMVQPIAALAFVTDGIHWGTGDFVFLRNVVVLATCCGSLAIVIMDMLGVTSLTAIWWITGAWVFIRAVLGVLRLWPGTARSPLNRAPVMEG
ncbi:MATE family efflux transporter [Desulforhopalus singaporensis]|uniref:Multidrug resistance protein, MATE family n=1 Tax=Desulforhopalus singaporensis TaxID=91360 RepID=A0A1H0KJ75_9BACT|nr:MATE family efflux transporter [Desulforhopalus singaporensis]SDO55810.1 multidrug resistance protein, MATE family [Desulforhopalus singaporensis]